MTVAPSSPDGSSTSRRTPSPRSPRSGKVWRTSASAGSDPSRRTPGRVGGRATDSPPSRPPSDGPWLTPGAAGARPARHGIRPKKSLGQHFLVEPRLARRIVDLAEVGPGVRVLEIGAGLGSLTVELARAGADVLAVEVDRSLLPALGEAVGSFTPLRVQILDAATPHRAKGLGGSGPRRGGGHPPCHRRVPGG